MNKQEKKLILKNMKKMLTTTALGTTGIAALTACGKTNTNNSNTSEPTGIISEAVTEAVTPTATVKVEITPTGAVATITEKVEEQSEYGDDYFEYTSEPTYEGTLVDGYDPSKFVVGPDGNRYVSQEDVDNLFPERPEDVNAPYTFGGVTYIDYITYLEYSNHRIEVELNEDNMYAPKEYQKQNCK